jgi:phosphopantothenoylcysteine decarboxylase/phosphopantothenate--cysteine ligase
MHSRKQRNRLRFLITAGGTREYIDPVRFISNASSGRMGYELARAAAAAGHRVTLITGPSSMRTPAGVRIVNVETSAEMFASVRKHFVNCDCLVMAAAISDYAPQRCARAKIKKGRQVITLKLKPTPDILKWAGSHKKRKQVVTGFALGDKNLKINAERKLRDKNLDIVVANRPETIGRSYTTVDIKKKEGTWIRIRRVSKRAAARRIIRIIENL